MKMLLKKITLIFVVFVFSVFANAQDSLQRKFLIVSPNEKLSVNVADLSQGMYLCNLKVGEVSNAWKIIVIL
jgi:hypothetical protein